MRAALVATCIVVGLLLVAPACQLPIAICEEGVERWTLRFYRDELVPLASGAFRTSGIHVGPGRSGTFASCVDLCMTEYDVKRVRACTAPMLVDQLPTGQVWDGNKDSGAPSWLMECTAETVHCDVPRTGEVGAPTR